MPERMFTFDAIYDDLIIDDAANAFVQLQWRKYRALLVAACVVNVIGFIVVLLLPGGSVPMTVAIGTLAALGPVYFTWRYRRLPSQLAAPMKRGLKPVASVRIEPSGFSMSAKGHSVTIRWSSLRAIREYPDYFLFVVTLLSFTFIPKKAMSLEAQQLVREVSIAENDAA